MTRNRISCPANKSALILYSIFTLICCSCNTETKEQAKSKMTDSMESCSDNLPKRYGSIPDTLGIKGTKTSHEGMVLIPSGEFLMGAADDEGRPDEYPQHKVTVKAFYMDATEVTNAQFSKFVKETNYITTAEKKPDWEEMRKQLPAGTPKPEDSVLVAASLVFHAPAKVNGLSNPGQWWRWEKGADWKHPQGPKSTITGKENYPVVQISWDDAFAYCKWAGKRLPTEAEWEYAARGGLGNDPYPWGTEDIEKGKPKANTWQGSFPIKNSKWDGYYGLAPVKQFAANGYGLYDVAGNVWEWCNDWYKANPEDTSEAEKVIRGGSFMCNASYCKGYRVTSKMKSSRDTGLENTGFRCVSSN